MGLVGNLGSERVIDTNMGEVVLCDAKFENGRSGQVSVTVGRDQSIAIPFLENWLEFRIFFGSGGVGAYTPWVKFFNGFTIPCQTSHCRLSVRYHVTPLVPPIPQQKVYGFICEGAAPKKYSALDSQTDAADLPMNFSLFYGVPAFARAVSIIPSYEANYGVMSITDNGPLPPWTPATPMCYFYHGEMAREILIDGCCSLQVKNFSPNLIRVRLIWHIEF